MYASVWCAFVYGVCNSAFCQYFSVCIVCVQSSSFQPQSVIVSLNLGLLDLQVLHVHLQLFGSDQKVLLVLWSSLVVSPIEKHVLLSVPCLSRPSSSGNISCRLVCIISLCIELNVPS